MSDPKINKSVNYYSGTVDEYKNITNQDAANGAFIDIVDENGLEQGIVLLNGVPIGFKEGLQGIIGTQGYEGTQGETGAQGEIGTQGEIGAQGEVGTQGETGAQGEIGTQGKEGTRGERGVQGYAGTQGEVGS